MCHIGHTTVRYRLSAESAWHKSKCRRRHVVRRHMMFHQFPSDNKRNSAVTRTLWERSQLLRQHCTGWVCGNVGNETCLVINTNLSYGQLSNEIDDDFISVRAFTSVFIDWRRVTATAADEWQKIINFFFSLRGSITMLLSWTNIAFFNRNAGRRNKTSDKTSRCKGSLNRNIRVAYLIGKSGLFPHFAYNSYTVSCVIEILLLQKCAWLIPLRSCVILVVCS